MTYKKLSYDKFLLSRGINQRKNRNARNKLNFLVLERGVKPKFVAEYLGIYTENIYRFIRNQSNMKDPNIDKLNELFELYNFNNYDKDTDYTSEYISA